METEAQEEEPTGAGGPLCGRGLADLAAEFGPDLVGAAVWRRFEGGFPLLIKLIDACDDLSVQVHPDDAYARAAVKVPPPAVAPKSTCGFPSASTTLSFVHVSSPEFAPTRVPTISMMNRTSMPTVIL